MLLAITKLLLCSGQCSKSSSKIILCSSSEGSVQDLFSCGCPFVQCYISSSKSLCFYAQVLKVHIQLCVLVVAKEKNLNFTMPTLASLNY
jgi:hypothetical protein